jgi:hypothetical protein
MPTIVRQVIDGPSREELFDALRLHPEGREFQIHVAPDNELGTTGLESALRRMKTYRLRFSYDRNWCGIDPRDQAGNVWFVQAVLAEPFRTSFERHIRFEALLNTRERRNSGELTVSWDALGPRS